VPTPPERLGYIVSELFSRDEVRVSQLATELGVSEVAIRKDLDNLQKYMTVDRFYGGARLVSAGHRTSFYEVKSRRCPEEKELIASFVAEHLVNDGDNLLLDSGTQMKAFVKALKRHHRTGIRVFSQAANFGDEFLDYPEADYIQLGGVLNTRAVVFLDSSERFYTESFFEEMNSEFFKRYCEERGTYIAVVTGTAFSCRKGIAVNTADIINYKRQIIRLAEKVIILIDHSKFDLSARDTVTHCGLQNDDWLEAGEEKDAVIVIDTNWGDDEPSPEFKQLAESKSIKRQVITDDRKYSELAVFKTKLVGAGGAEGKK